MSEDKEMVGKISIEWETLKCPCCKQIIDLKGKKHEFGNVFGESEMFCPKCDELLEIHPKSDINFEDNKIYADVVSHRKQVEFRERALSKESLM